MDKKGQVSMFIIMGIVVMIIIGAMFYIGFESAKITPSESEPGIDMSSLNSFVSSCAKQTAQDAVVFAGLRGGVEYPDKFVYYTGINVPYYFIEGAEQVPSDDTIKKTMKHYMDSSLKKCTNNFDFFRKQGFEVNESGVNSVITIAEEDIIFNINYPITLIKGRSRESESDFNAQVRIEMPKMISAAREYIEAQKQEPEYLRIKHLTDISDKEDLYYEVINKGQGNMIISFIDTNTVINGNPFIFSFAVKYA